MKVRLLEVLLLRVILGFMQVEILRNIYICCPILKIIVLWYCTLDSKQYKIFEITSFPIVAVVDFRQNDLPDKEKMVDYKEMVRVLSTFFVV